MSELLNQPQLEHAIDEILYGKHEQPYSKGDALLMLINTQKRLYAESVIETSKEIILTHTGADFEAGYIKGREDLRAEQRARIR